MPRIEYTVVERIIAIRSAWSEVAEDASFGDMTLEEFKVAIAPPETIRNEIMALETRLISKMAQRSIADKAARELLERVMNSIRSTEGFGPDCELYRACGYVRKSDRKSGLTRKSKQKGADAASSPAKDAA